MRKPKLVIVITALLLVGLASGVFAKMDYDDSKWVKKWAQPPDMLCGFDYSSQTRVPSIVADDFLCLDGLPITDIHWWGSYWSNVDNTGKLLGDIYYEDSRGFAPPGGIEAFLLKIWSDVPKTTDPKSFSHPGQLLWQYVTTDFNESFYGNVPGKADVYQYFMLLPEQEQFRQEKGTIYWLSIEAVLKDCTKQWGWHESSKHWNDLAVQDFMGSGWYTLGQQCCPVDMAFEITTVPEPFSMLLAASGLGMVGAYFKSRRKT